jgi:AGCS family alanine or glycine:cation symporter
MEEIIGVFDVWHDAFGWDRDIFLKNVFLQIRHIKEMFRLLFDGKSSESEFLFLSMSLAGRVGTGNMQV